MLIHSEEELLKEAALFATRLKPGDVVFLEGELGAGKTTFSRGVLRALGFEGRMKSPTFTLLETYEMPALSVHHYDLYRLTDPEELEYLGFRDQLASHAIFLIEWPSKGAEQSVSPTMRVKIQHRGGEMRELDIEYLRA